MTSAESQPNTSFRPRVGIPWRTTREEAENNRRKIENYEQAVLKAGGEPVLLPLTHPSELQLTLPTLDAFVLPGSPSDVEPREYGSENLGLSGAADLHREETDSTILDHAFANKKPVLAICYGHQFLNVHLGGTLIQDLRTETGTKIAHRKKDLQPEPTDDPRHHATLETGSRLATIAGNTHADVNSSHHQAIRKPGKNLRITARASDGTVEAVEWTGDSNWVTGVQWHPERMFGDPFSERIFRDFVAAACAARGAVASRS